MKIKVAILEKDISYLNRLVSVFSTKFVDKLEIYSFTDEEVAYSSLAQSRIDIFLASSVFEVDMDRVPPKCSFAYLVEAVDIESFRNQGVLYKFQRVDLIYKQIISLYSEKAEQTTVAHTGNGGSTKIISFLSASGGTGSSTVAAACAVRFGSMGKKVLYLNLEQFGSADVFFQAEGNGNFGDIIYAIKSKRGNLLLKLESLVKKDESGVFFYSSALKALDMAELKAAECVELLNMIRDSGDYEYIILDMDFSLAKEEVQVLRQCNRIVLVNDGSSTSNEKLTRVIDSIAILEEMNDWNLMSRCSLLYNRFSSKTSTTLNIEQINELGGIKRFEGYDTHQLIQQLAQLPVLDKLL